MNISKKRLKAIKDINDDIDTSDIPELGDAFWNKTKLRMPDARSARRLAQLGGSNKKATAVPRRKSNTSST